MKDKAKVNFGTNYFVFERANLDDMPEEIKFMMELADEIVRNSIRRSREEGITPSVLPSAHLEAFKLFFPRMVIMVDEDGQGNVNDYIDGHIKALKMMIESLEGYKK